MMFVFTVQYCTLCYDNNARRWRRDERDHSVMLACKFTYCSRIVKLMIHVVVGLETVASGEWLAERCCCHSGISGCQKLLEQDYRALCGPGGTAGARVINQDRQG